MMFFGQLKAFRFFADTLYKVKSLWAELKNFCLIVYAYSPTNRKFFFLLELQN